MLEPFTAIGFKLLEISYVKTLDYTYKLSCDFKTWNKFRKKGGNWFTNEFSTTRFSNVFILSRREIVVFTFSYF